MIERWALIPFMDGEGIDVEGELPVPIGTAVRLSVGQLRLFAHGSLDYVLVRRTLTSAQIDACWALLKPGGRLVVWAPKDPGMNIPEALGPAASWKWVEHVEDEKMYLQAFVKKESGPPEQDIYTVPARSAAVFRIGWGYGDALWASSLYAHLKEQGYAVTAYVGKQGAEVIEHDPNVDRVIVVRGKVMKTSDLPDFWAHEMVKHDVWINTFGVVESQLMLKPDQAGAFWPTKLRQRLCDHNYMEAYHDLACLPYDFRVRFYSTEDEREIAREERQGAARMVVLVDSGTHLTKWWPYLGDLALELVSRREDVRVVVLGDVRSRFPDHERVTVLGTDYTFRQAAAIAQEADVVVGQDTGLLTAVSMEKNAKVVLLGHSSPENITKHWRNTVTLAADVPCRPCHIAHADWSLCRQDPATKAALCQSSISRAEVFAAIEGAL